MRYICMYIFLWLFSLVSFFAYFLFFFLGKHGKLAVAKEYCLRLYGIL